jgi:hypothetical protein
MKAKPNKYNAKKTLYDGRMYDSKAEAAFAAKLKMAMSATKLADRVILIKLQVPYVINVNGSKICKYIADFRVTYGDGNIVVYDVKGVKTSIYNLKKKLVKAVHGIEIIEVKK